MRRNLDAYKHVQVFLNYPFDDGFVALAEAMSFAVVAGGLLPLCALDVSSPDRPRLEMLIEMVGSCRYSAHDLSRATGSGTGNFARMNMPFEMGMAIFHALTTQRQEHRCAFFVPTQHDYNIFISDLSGLDPKVHNNNDAQVLTGMYDWLRGIVPSSLFNSQPTIDVRDKFAEYKRRKANIRGSLDGGALSHEESRELMYQLCAECGWWDWRNHRMGRDEFPIVPLSLNNAISP